jgi:hypothetical protein
LVRRGVSDWALAVSREISRRVGDDILSGL